MSSIGATPGSTVGQSSKTLSTSDQTNHTVASITIPAHSGGTFEVVTQARVTVAGSGGNFTVVDSTLSARVSCSAYYTGSGNAVIFATHTIWADSGVNVTFTGAAGGVVNIALGASGSSSAPQCSWTFEFTWIGDWAF